MGHQDEERDVFLCFAKVHPGGIDTQTIESRRPREPDIRCQTAGGPCAFELVELLDPDETRNHRREIDMAAGLRCAFRVMSTDRQVKAMHSVGDAEVRIFLFEAASATALRRIIPQIIDFLLTVDQTLEGEVPQQPWWKGAIRAMWLDRRPGLVGPLFYVPASPHCYTANPILPRIREKFTKKYESDAPLELLAYHSYRIPPSPEQLWRCPVESFLRENIRESQFRRIWLFDYQEKRIDLVIPAALP